jgi:chemotaxis protein methyltransferase CheR
MANPIFNEIKNRDFIEITDLEFNKIRDLIYHHIGISLSTDKRELVRGRLQKVLHKMQFGTFSDYYSYLISDKEGFAISELANIISTNHTFFGREWDHFEYFFKYTLPDISERFIKPDRKDFRIWCAGCSTGEEPYTLVMLMMDYFGIEYNSLDAGILATDISEKVLNIAKAGIYSEDKIDKMKPELRKKYFKKIDKSMYQVIDSLKKEVVFRRFNLINPVFPFKKQFHVIFCRNVMIYFDQQTRENLLEKFYNFLVPGGWLFIGHSETLSKKDSKFRYLKPAVYQKNMDINEKN